MGRFHLCWLFAWLLMATGWASQPIGTLDLQELMDVQYSVTILDTPVSDEEALVDESMTAMVMVNKEGQKYRCSVPKMDEKEDEEDDGGQDATPDVKALLQPLEEAHCIFKTKDWWTYEICYNRQIKQYHVENDRPVGAVMVLGVHRYLPLDCIVYQFLISHRFQPRVGQLGSIEPNVPSAVLCQRQQL